jgi:tetratricopeptide (TPR) repeat protein
VTLIALGRDGNALVALDRALELEPKFARAWRNRAVAHSRQERDREALATCDPALGLDSALGDAWRAKVNVLRTPGRAAQARRRASNLVRDIRYSFEWIAVRAQIASRRA